MFDAPTAFSYHSSNAQNARGLFGNIAMPSALPTQLLSSSLAMLPLSSYFSQQEKTSQNITSPDTNDLSSPTAPQQPTHNNNNTSRRVTHQKQQKNSLSTAIASNPEASNMGSLITTRANLLSPITTSNNNRHNSIVANVSTSQSPAASHTHRRKKPSNKLNRKKIDQAIAFSAFAVEEDHQGNPDCALDLYLLGLEHMLEALPIHADQSRKDALVAKLRDFMDRAGLTEEFSESTNSKEGQVTSSTSENSRPEGPGISQHIIQAAITSAVALKQSPIPDAISATVNYTMNKIKTIDEAYGLQDKAWEISRTGINLALEIDQQYNVHEKVGNALFIGLAAAMKAGIAYKDSSSYRDLKKLQVDYETAGNDNTLTITEEC
ncbi:bsd domain protein [Gigaspora margarita]|uniref:Bsd domain protein n=1 Tax=Gigaspora margarita TaxID=4874 RepID=A0A8H3XFB9_GIGMA|nr:bsd domain protein [Gigaspora margarita]